MQEKRKWIRFGGECLEAIGFPISGKALVDYNAVPRIFDVVLCTNAAGAVYLKEIVDTGNQALGRRPFVHTRYKDHKKNFAFWPVEIIGVVLEAKNDDGVVVWRRPSETDAVVVTRCVNCVYSNDCVERGWYMGDDGFCSKGKPMNGRENK